MVSARNSWLPTFKWAEVGGSDSLAWRFVSEFLRVGSHPYVKWNLCRNANSSICEAHVFKALIGTDYVNIATEQCRTSACTHCTQLLWYVEFLLLEDATSLGSLILVFGFCGQGLHLYPLFTECALKQSNQTSENVCFCQNKTNIPCSDDLSA
jgi:hypothetical protein